MFAPHRRTILISVAVMITSCCAANLAGAPQPAAKAGAAPATHEPRFRVPPGFVIEKVAGPPLVEHPMMGCFDERGRLFLAESAGLNLGFDDLQKRWPNFIRVLDAADGNGRFHKGHVFADKLTFPMGVLWYRDALYTTAAPSLWQLRDTKGGGKADVRRALVSKFSSTGNGADIHGPFLGPDGRLYWTKGRHPHDIRLPDGREFKGLGARIFRCKPDGSELEVVCGGGMDDPVEIAFTPEGEPLATVDIFISQPRRIDAIIYGIEGGVYPHAAEVMGEFQHTGDLLPAVADLGWVAPAGLMRYRGRAFGQAYEGNLFSAQFNTHKVQRHILERDGATFRARTEEFLVSTDPDFHPTDVLEDADGSLLVIDTGGWFRIGCPTSQIAKPDVKGGIYRVRRQHDQKEDRSTGEKRETARRPEALKAALRSRIDPWGLAAFDNNPTPASLVKLLDDPRWPVRDRAVDHVARAPAAVPELRKVLRDSPPVRARRNAVWAATRMGTPAALTVIRSGLLDKDAGVRIAAAHGAGLLRDAQALPLLMGKITSDVPAVRREAALALGRLRRAAAVPTLFEGLREGGDRFLEHALLYALIEIADRKATARGLRDPSPAVRRGALIALDQMEGGKLTREEVTPLLNTDDPALQRTALAIIVGRPGWAAEITGLLRQWLGQDRLDEARRQSLRGALLAFAKDIAVQDLIAGALHRDTTLTDLRLLLLETMARAPLEKPPASWVKELGRALHSRDERVVRQAVATFRASGVSEFDKALLDLARASARPAELRVAALAAMGPRLVKLDDRLFDFLVGQLAKDNAPLVRLAAAEALGDAGLNDSQLDALSKRLTTAGVLEMPHLLAAFEHSRDAAVGKQLMTALEKAPGLAGLSPEALRRTLEHYPADVRQAARPLLKRLSVGAEKQQARLAELRPVLSGGDSRRGRDVFFGKKAACSTCHAVQGHGGHVGPDLSKIGSIRTGRDLLEAIVFPSASIVRGYEPYVVATAGGRYYTGIITRQTADAIELVTAERAEVRVPRREIESVERSPVSIMPQGLDTQLSRQELADVIAFLQALQ
jgi:putative membrane-bound dehydrogenase-like protein